ncbi:hypothetical protein RU97_GL002637 [Enterococcus canis]|uniref:Membrane protein 6-pyruvoyl-tetrahydropterin synthase-related domain-containing protein n=2 Tax=Enterococcus canis TaxID=214095 RepID=A0A1L8RCJ0_9ENTE|nr:hypothetical protein RU97_GL002637 [Enterococcus canis]
MEEKLNTRSFNMNRTRHRTSPSKPLVLAIALIGFAAFLMVSPQFFDNSFILGNDVMFHFNRFYDTFKQFQTGHFSYYQTLFGFSQSGRIINALYGPDFAYLQGLLLFVAKNWFRYQLLSAFLCFFVSGITMYALTSKVKVRFDLRILTSLLYMSSSVVYYYALSQNYTSWGAAFAPLIYIPAIRIIQNEEKPIDVLELSLAVTSLLFLHNLTLLITLISIVPFFLIGLIRSRKKLKLFGLFFGAVGLTILLNFNTLVGFLDVYLSNKILPPWIYDDMLDKTVHFSLGESGWSALGIVFTVIMLFQVFHLIFHWHEASLLEKIITVVGATFLILSSNLIPWNFIADHLDFIKILQFPRRLAVVAYILLLLGNALTLEKIDILHDAKLQKLLVIIMAVFAFISVSEAYSKVLDAAEKWHTDSPTAAGNNGEWLETKNPDKIRAGFTSGRFEDAFKVIQKATPDYLPYPDELTEADVVNNGNYGLYDKQIIHNKLDVTKTINAKNELVLHWKSAEAKKVILPVIIYGHSTVAFNEKTLEPKEIQRTQIGAPELEARAGENTLVVGYKPVISVGLMFIVKIIGILLTLMLIIFKLMKIRQTKNSR